MRGNFIIILLLCLPAFSVGCGDTSCSQDTDCKLPQVCVNAVCVDKYTVDVSVDMPVELDMPPETDMYDIDGFEMPEVDAIDLPVEDVTAEDVSTECTPSVTLPRAILGTDTDSGEGEHPEVVALTDGSFFLLGRKILDGGASAKLTVVKVTTAGTRGAEPIDILGTTTLPPYHPFVPVSDGMGVFFKDLAGIAGQRIVFIMRNSSGAHVGQWSLGETDTDTIEAAGVDNNVSVFTVWAEHVPASGGNLIKGGFVTYAGALGASNILVGTGMEDFGQPAIAFNGESYLLACFIHGDPDVDGSKDQLLLAEISSAGTTTASEAVELTNPAANLAVGRPVAAWAGTKWAVLWQESYDGTGVDTYLHLTTKVPAGMPLDTDIRTQWNPPITDFSARQTGELDMVWTGSRLGIAIKHDGLTAGKNVYFAEFSADGARVGDPALRINNAGTSNYNPSIAFTQTGGNQHYLFSWLQYSAEIYQVNVAAYGCD